MDNEELKQLLEKYKNQGPSLHDNYVNDSAVNSAMGSFTDLANAGAKSAGATDLTPGSDLTTRLQSTTDKQYKEKSAMDSMDPQSDVSKFYRENAKSYARKAGLDEGVVSRLDNMSAEQLEKLGFKLPNPGKPGDFELTTFVDPKDGIRKRWKLDKDNGVPQALGADPFGLGFSTDPNGRVNVVNKVDGSYKPLFPGPDPNMVGPQYTQPTDPNQPPVRKPKTPFEVRSILNASSPKKWDEIEKNAEKFQNDIKGDLESFYGINQIGTNSIKLALENPVANKQTGAMIAKIFQGNRLTDKDVELYVNRNGLINNIKDWTQKWADGTLEPTQATQLAEALAVYQKGLEKSLQKQAKYAAGMAISDIDPKLDIQPSDIQGKFFQPLRTKNYEAGIQAVMTKNSIPRDQAILALKKANKLPQDWVDNAGQ